MKTMKSERRRTPRQAVNRAAQIKTGNGARKSLRQLRGKCRRPR